MRASGPFRFVALGHFVLLAWSAPVGAQEEDGSVVLARDVPTGYAFLPHEGEATTVRAAPLVDIWDEIGAPPTLITDEQAAGVNSNASTFSGPAGLTMAATNLLTATLKQGNPNDTSAHAAGGGVSALVSSALDTGLSSLNDALSQITASTKPAP